MLTLSIFSYLFVCGVSATSFSYQRIPQIFRRTPLNPCKICYGVDDCFLLGQAVCSYYMETAELLKENDEDNYEENFNDNIPISKEVDDILYNALVEEISDSQDHECIPFVSYYTDCTKDNICLGCMRCHCSINGKWQCEDAQKCRPDTEFTINQRNLMILREKLLSISLKDQHRTKRSSLKSDMKPGTIEVDQMSEWIGLIDPNNTSKNDLKVNATNLISGPSITFYPAKKHDTEYLTFNELLSSVSLGNTIKSRRKPLYQLQTDEDNHNIIEIAFENSNETSIARTSDVNSTPKVDSKVVVDLLKTFNENEHEKDIDNNLKSSQRSKRNIPVQKVSHIKTHQPVKKLEKNNSTVGKKELKENVLLPIIAIIDDKEKELNQLFKIKENVMNLLNIQQNAHYNKTNPDNNTSFSIYKLEISDNPNITYAIKLEKYLSKLKEDIFQVLQDIINIRNHSNTNDLPDNVQSLEKFLTYFIDKSSKYLINHKYEFTRRMEDSQKTHMLNCIINIIDLINVKNEKPFILALLSSHTKRLIKRIIKLYYEDEFATVGLKVNDPHYNLTNDLKMVGKNWKTMTEVIAKSSLSDQIYEIKKLHLLVSRDINKMTDAMAILDFTMNRRMSTVDENAGVEVIHKINNVLGEVYNNVSSVFNGRKSFEKSAYNLRQKSLSTLNKKKSFLSKLKKLLKKSKSHLFHKIQKKTPESVFFNEMSKESIKDISDNHINFYEKALKNRQSSSDSLYSRHKRSSPQKKHKYRKRIKNIIPKYLRGKVKPAIDAKELKKNLETLKNKGT